MPDVCTTSEEWRPVVGWEGLYEVSDHGSMKSLTRRVPLPCGASRIQAGRIMRPRIVNGYPMVSLCRSGRVVQRSVHRIVLEAFVGPCPDGSEACHANDVPSDARLLNLRWDTHRANVQDRVTNGSMRRGEENGFAKLTEADVREIRRLREDGVKQRDVAKQFGISQGTVSFIALRQTWRHV